MRISVSTAAGAALATVLVAAGLLVAPSVAMGQTAVTGCADLGSTGEARALLRGDSSLASVLDADGDGRACGTVDYRTIPPVDRGYSVAATVAPTVQAVVDAIGALSCSNYFEETRAIDDAVFELTFNMNTDAATLGAIADRQAARYAQYSSSCFASDGGSTTPPADVPPSDVDAILDAIAALGCDGYSTQLGAISDAVVAGSGAISFTDLGRINDARDARIAELDYCVEDFVVPTLDDGSTASISGDQVSVVPEGSAETGGV